MGSDDYSPAIGEWVWTFQSTLPAWGATWQCIAFPMRFAYFNPRSPHGERRVLYAFIKILSTFQSTLPAWGATGKDSPPGKKQFHFNPRSPHGERLHLKYFAFISDSFQSTLPAWGATYLTQSMPLLILISIHAPRMGSDFSYDTVSFGV